MASILNADNGSVSGSAGLKSTADSSGVLALQTNGTTAISIDASQNVNFPVSGQRITGDFSNATVANRVIFQTSTANSATRIDAIPSGTGTVGEFGLFNNSDTTNAGYAAIRMRSGDMQITSEINGTGTYVPMTFFIGGSERVRIDTSGNVGIGRSPNYQLDVYRSGTTNTTVASANDNVVNILQVSGNTAGVIGTITSHPLVFTAGNTERMRIDSSGNVGIGTSSPSANLDVTSTNTTAYSATSYNGASARLTLKGGNATSAFNGIRFSNGVNGEALFGAVQDSSGYEAFVWQSYNGAYAERMRIDSSGNLLVNRATQTSDNGRVVMQEDGSVKAVLCLNNSDATSTSQYLLRSIRNGNTVGGITNTNTNTAFPTSSDYRLKNTIAPMTNALAKVSLLKPCIYKWNLDGSDGEGFIAHELQAVVPDAVIGEKDAVDTDGNPVYQGIDTSFLVATLTAAIQEQQALITQLQADVAALKGATA